MSHLLRFQFLFCFVLASFFQSSVVKAMMYSQFTQRPKLVVVLVIDQFRADYLTRFEKEFRPQGFRKLMQEGAYFPFAEYDVLQNMTCPGHAMILTGSYPANNGIVLNEFYDKEKQKVVYCAEDDQDGISPRRLRVSTVGDELKLVSSTSKVISIALKDRSAVMLAGHRADVALWYDSTTNQWGSSSFYPKATKDSFWNELNQKLQRQVQEKKLDKSVVVQPVMIDQTVQLAQKAIQMEKLGKRGVTDLLTLSFSTHDLLGHRVGMLDPLMKAMTLHEDRALESFFQFLKKENLLNQTLIVLTADHGVAPVVEFQKENKMPSDYFPILALYKKWNELLDAQFGRPSQPWFHFMAMHLYLQPQALLERKVSEKEVLEFLQQKISLEKGVFAVVTKQQIQRKENLPESVEKQVLRSYLPGQSGDLIMIPNSFYLPSSEVKANHLTHYSYDRTVPVVYWGRAFRSSVYPGGHVIDIASTLSFVLGMTAPSGNQGQVPSQILK